MKNVMARDTRRVFGLVVVALLSVACNTTSAPKARGDVAFHLAADAKAVPTASVAASPLEITAVRLVAGAAALGSGDQYGCVDCQESDFEARSVQQLVDVPLGTGSVLLASEQVDVGTYPSVEINLELPTSATRTANPSWPALATIQIAGRFNGSPFVLPLTIRGSFRESLSPPVTVSTGAAANPVAVRITLPVASWFVWNGRTLDPSVAGQRALIWANARASISADGT